MIQKFYRSAILRRFMSDDELADFDTEYQSHKTETVNNLGENVYRKHARNNPFIDGFGRPVKNHRNAKMSVDVRDLPEIDLCDQQYSPKIIIEEKSRKAHDFYAKMGENPLKVSEELFSSDEKRIEEMANSIALTTTLTLDQARSIVKKAIIK